MNCPACGRLIPANVLSCQACLEERRRREQQNYQREALRAVPRERLEVTLRTIRGVRHVQMFGGMLFGLYTFCGERVEAKHPRTITPWEPGDPEKLRAKAVMNLCPACCLELGRALEEVAA